MTDAVPPRRDRSNGTLQGTRQTQRIAIGTRPSPDPAATWVQQGAVVPAARTSLYTARLTVDVTPALRARIKITAFEHGITVADMLRTLLEQEYAGAAP